MLCHVVNIVEQNTEWLGEQAIAAVKKLSMWVVILKILFKTPKKENY